MSNSGRVQRALILSVYLVSSTWCCMVFLKPFLLICILCYILISACLGLAQELNPQFVILTVFTSNFVAIVFARTLHYQFYCWYFHTIPYLLWHCSSAILPVPVKLLIFGAIEVCFNVFPATPWSSLLLQV
jgi:hypothetical protein